MNDIEYLKKYLKPEDFESGLKRLENKEPIQYIIGNVEFYGYKINVNKNVLIPRFETELLVEKTINYIKKYLGEKIDIIDLGTGSGCIAITLKKEIDCNMDALDISKKALEVAKNNAKLNNVEINFINKDMLTPLDKKYDVIISNPPYISYDEEIMDIVKNNEPNIALYAKNKGLYYYEELIKNIHKYLKEKYIIAFEIGYMQGDYLKEYSRKYFKDAIITVEQDLSKKDRFLFIINM